MLEREELTSILVQVLTSDEKWQSEVERNMLLQKTIDELFNDDVFLVLLEAGAIPKYADTTIPHYRAVEMICAFRELAQQIEEGGAERSLIDRELEDLQMQLIDKWDTSDTIEVQQPPPAALDEARRIADVYSEDRQFATRLDNFRLLVVPLSVVVDGTRACQVVVLENIRPPRSRWKRQQ